MHGIEKRNREIPKPKSHGNSKAQKEEGILTADYAEGSDKEEL